MLSTKFRGTRKSAEVTMEMALTLALSIVVLFVVFNLFNGNLATMVNNSGIKNMFKDNSNKIAYQSYQRDYTQSQINVGIMGEQGTTLNSYLSQASTTINKYKQTPPTTEAQMEDLAKAITILAVNAGSTSGIEPALRTKYGISIQLNKVDTNTGSKISKTIVNGNTITYSSTTDTDTLSIIKEILNKNF